MNPATHVTGSVKNGVVSITYQKMLRNAVVTLYFLMDEIS